MFPGDQHTNNRLGSNPFIEEKISSYTATEIATLQAKLDQQLGPEYISSRPGAGGKKVHYIQADKCINLANQVFGFNGWCSSITNMEVDFLDQSKDGKWSVGISVTIRVTLKDGTYHEDVGYGTMENGKNKAQVFEKAKKEGTTDGLKRALRTFGNVLGNCLYDKEYLTKITRVKAPPLMFDEKKLHRHNPDSKECTPPTKPEPVSAPAQLAIEPRSAQESQSDGSDEYGGDELDELGFLCAGDDIFDDLMPDEVATIDTTYMDTPSKPGTGVGTGRNTMPPARMNSPTKQPIRQQIPRHNPAPPPPPPPQAPVPIKAQALAPRQKVQRNIPTPPPPAPESHPQTTGSHRHTSIGPNPTTTVNQQQRHNMGNRLGQQPGHSRPGNNSNGPTIQSGTRTSTDNRNLDISNIKSALIPTMKAPQIQHRQPETPVPIPHNPPVGFYTGRAALNLEGSNGIIPEQAPAFNPHKPTTIPRSAGIDHTKSSPVPRKQIQGNPLGPSSPSAGFSPPNIQNPSLTPGRQIGVPPPGRTTAFRAPGLAGTKRTADSHNSINKTVLGTTPGHKLNAQSGSMEMGGTDAKRARN